MSEGPTQGRDSAGLGPGTVVLLADPDSDELLPAIVRRASEDALTVIPVNARLHVATEWDLILTPVALGYPALAQVWNFGSALVEQVADVVGEIPVVERAALDKLVHASRNNDSVPAGIPVGCPVLDADPRLLEQEAAAEAVRAYWAPALALAGAATIGQLVHHRREELGVDARELESLGGIEGQLNALETDDLDLQTALPTKALALLLRRLRIGRSRRLAQVTLWTLEAQGPALARKGLSRPAGSADDYVADLMQDLEDS
jgi:hypothetical protein